MSFESKSIPVLKPSLPKAADLMPYLEMIDNNRWYTNWGPLTQLLEKRLAEHFNVLPEHLVIVSNGTDALSVALMAMNRTGKKYCILPSWSFVASAVAPKLIGIEPIFVDVDLATWTITPSGVKKALQELKINPKDVHSVVPVSPFGAPLNTQEWVSFQEETNIKVLIDAAASFDSFSNKNTPFAPSKIPTMVSLHATKVFGIGEGAVVVSQDVQHIHEIRRRINFGFYGKREAEVLGMNAKISEYASAVGLAELDRWTSKRNDWQRCTDSYLKYKQELSSKGIQLIPGFGDKWISSYFNVLFSNKESKELSMQKLKANGIDTREWWGQGIHKQSAFNDSRASSLPNTIDLAERSLGLPFYTDLLDAEIQSVIACISQG